LGKNEKLVRSFTPVPILQPYIDAITIIESAGETIYKVLPGTGLVMGFQYKGRISRLSDLGDELLSVSGITGLQDSAVTFRNTAHTGTVLVSFKPAGAAAFFPIPIHELFRSSIDLEELVARAELLPLQEKLCEAATDQSKFSIVEDFLLSRLNSTAPDKLVSRAVDLINQSKGNIRISDLAKQLYTSQSPLEKRFRSIVGSSPKKFASIVRMKHVLDTGNRSGSLTGLAHQTGFYDQAHFIKDFKNLTGETPESFFGKE
jgi:AraC-like DNA-binding protein